MNKRIKELAEQATKHYPAIESSGEFWAFDKEKFAELIVRECAKVSERTGALNDADFEGEMIAEAIKEQFGIEK